MTLKVPRALIRVNMINVHWWVLTCFVEQYNDVNCKSKHKTCQFHNLLLNNIWFFISKGLHLLKKCETQQKFAVILRDYTDISLRSLTSVSSNISHANFVFLFKKNGLSPNAIIGFPLDKMTRVKKALSKSHNHYKHYISEFLTYLLCLWCINSKGWCYLSCRFAKASNFLPYWFRYQEMKFEENKLLFWKVAKSMRGK